MSAMPTRGLVNEQALDGLQYLNKSDIILKIDSAKRQVVRAVVSDMRGGVTIVILSFQPKGKNLPIFPPLLDQYVRIRGWYRVPEQFWQKLPSWNIMLKLGWRFISWLFS